MKQETERSSEKSPPRSPQMGEISVSNTRHSDRNKREGNARPRGGLPYEGVMRGLDLTHVYVWGEREREREREWREPGTRRCSASALAPRKNGRGLHYPVVRESSEAQQS